MFFLINILYLKFFLKISEKNENIYVSAWLQNPAIRVFKRVMVNVIFINDVGIRVSRVCFPVAPVVSAIGWAIVPGVRTDAVDVCVLGVEKIIVVDEVVSAALFKVDPVILVLTYGIVCYDVVLACVIEVDTGVIVAGDGIVSYLVCTATGEIYAPVVVFSNQIVLEKR